MRSTLLHLLHLIAASAVVNAQNIVPTSSSASFPACAVSCTVLHQAQTLCTPPTVAANTQLSYENCFCQSSILQALYSTPDSICTAECTVESDRTLLQTWFLGFCKQVGQGVDPLAATAAGSTTVVTITSTASNQATAATITGSGSSSQAAPPSRQTWIQAHWKWILMLGILIFGLLALAFIAIWLKKRHRRRIDQRTAAASGFPINSEKRGSTVRAATPDLWGPHQHMHATKGWEYHSDPSTSVASGGLGSSQKREHRNSSRERSSRTPAEMTTAEAKTKSSRRRSSKGKHRESADATELGARSRREQESRSRSRKRSERDRDKFFDRDVEQGVRGSKK